MKRFASALILAAACGPPAAAQCADDEITLPPPRETASEIARPPSPTTTYVCVGTVAAFATVIASRIYRDHVAVIAPRRRRPWDY